MSGSDPATLHGRIEALRHFYDDGLTRCVAYRLEALRCLRAAILRHETELYEALGAALHKSASESYLTETSVVLHEIDLVLRRLERWAKPRRARTPFFLLPSSSRITHQPLGVVLVISPWNYPFQLALVPLVGAVAAGNCVVLQPSSAVPQVNRVIGRILAESFTDTHVLGLDGGHETTDALLHERFDHIFFTGGTSFARAVLNAAAAHITPVTLELGGKSPCVVSDRADMAVTARRIVWGKLLNAGQTCVAPDYILVQQNMCGTLIEALKEEIIRAFGKDPAKHPQYPRIIHRKAFDRIKEAIDTSGGRIVYGGNTDAASLYIAPTLILEPGLDSKLMQEEIFGPVLPIICYKKIEEAEAFIRSREKPLAVYFFGTRKEGESFLAHTASGGACINDTVVQIANPYLPFGGVGNSGMGRYHGKASFELFSNQRIVMVSATHPDIPFRYAPYRSVSRLKKLV